MIVIFAEACLGKIWCKTGAKRGASGRALAPSAGTRRAKRSLAQALQSRQPWQPSFPLCYSRVSAFHWVRSDSISALSCHRRR